MRHQNVLNVTVAVKNVMEVMIKAALCVLKAVSC